MADTRNNIHGLRREGEALVIELPRRGKQKVQIPDQVIDRLMTALSSLELDSREGIVVPEDEDPAAARFFEKQHQATNFGRKLKDQIAERDKKVADSIAISTPPVDRDTSGKPIGPFLLALSKK